jgi:hypothetical protein
MASVRSRRVHGDLKKKILLSAYEGDIKILESRSRGFK